MRRCAYDGCHEFEPSVHNHRYCTECRCKRKEESRVKRLQVPREYGAEVWELEERRKEANALRAIEKNAWLLKNKTFAMFDIEASNLDADFGEILCACVRPLGGPTWTVAVDPLKWDGTITPAIRDELQKYDYIVTWYGAKFDMPYMTTRLIAASANPIGLVRHIDLYYTSRFKLKLHSNRLASVGDFMFGKTKKDSINGRIWLDALRGVKEAMDYLIHHCQKDVVELERVFRGLVKYRDLSKTQVRFY